MPDGMARQFTFVMKGKSIITFPSGGHSLHGKGFCEISGLAWSGRGRIRKSLQAIIFSIVRTLVVIH
jgi:sulfane dehydrogenase subunit SoxC